MKHCRYLSSEEGATSIEYAFIAILVSVAIILSVTLLGETVGNNYNNVATDVSDAVNN